VDPDIRSLVSASDVVARVLGGDERAERELYDGNVDRVYRLAFRMLDDPDGAADCTQETFIRVFEKLDTFRGESALSTWITSIAFSVVYNRLRTVKRSRDRELELDPGLEAPSRRQAEPDLKASLAAAIEALPDGYRTVFVMHDVEGYTHDEIAGALGIQEGTSKAQLSRARAKLRRSLNAFAGEWAR
jgi:RNA polymerase sigma-70 factor, ECF subfamily